MTTYDDPDATREPSEYVRLRTTFLLILGTGIAVAVLWYYLRRPSVHDDVWPLDPEEITELLPSEEPFGLFSGDPPSGVPDPPTLAEDLRKLGWRER